MFPFFPKSNLGKISPGVIIFWYKNTVKHPKIRYGFLYSIMTPSMNEKRMLLDKNIVKSPKIRFGFLYSIITPSMRERINAYGHSLVPLPCMEAPQPYKEIWAQISRNRHKLGTCTNPLTLLQYIHSFKVYLIKNRIL